jgi:hypothetical protein
MKLLGTVLLSSLLAGPGAEREDDRLKPFFDSVKRLVEKHYPKAQVTSAEAEIRFTFDTRRFMIHTANRVGEWQDAAEEIGPRKLGVWGEATVEAGRYEGQAVVPQEFDKHYFTLWLAAPYAEKLDRHLLVHLKYPRTAPKEFLKEFSDLVATFETLGR